MPEEGAGAKWQHRHLVDEGAFEEYLALACAQQRPLNSFEGTGRGAQAGRGGSKRDVGTASIAQAPAKLKGNRQG